MSVSYGGDSITFADGSVQSGGWTGFRNRIINGGMMIDQRYAGTATANTIYGYTVDRWHVTQYTVTGKLIAQQNAGSVSVLSATGQANYLGITSQSAYSVPATGIYVLFQAIEGFNFFDMQWGTANAKTVTLSFWVYSSLTGTFGGSLQNASLTRSYPFTYTISSANTWEQKTITVAGDTSGTWVGATNGAGVTLNFGLGVGTTYSGTAGAWTGTDYRSATGATSVVGTNGATFYITGVQLERGSTASSFEYRPYGTELALCQRYFQKSYDQANALGTVTTTGEVRWQAASTGGESAPTVMLPVVMRTAPTVTLYNTQTGASGSVYNYSTSTSTAMTGSNTNGSRGWSGGTTSFTAGHIIGYHFGATAEL